MTAIRCLPGHFMKVISFVPWLVLATLVLVLFGAIGYAANRAIWRSEPEIITAPVATPFTPASYVTISLLSPGPFKTGDLITAKGRLCNDTSETLTWIFALNVLSAESSSSDITNRLDIANSSPTALTALECRPLDLNLRPQLTPGMWKISLVLTIMGTQTFQTQRIAMETQAFEVLP